MKHTSTRRFRLSLWVLAVVGIYSLLATSLPARVLFLWPQLHYQIDVIQSSGSIWSGYRMDLRHKSMDAEWIAQGLHLHRYNQRWVISLDALRFQSLRLERLEIKPKDLNELPAKISGLPVDLKFRDLSFQGALNWPRLDCESLTLSEGELNLSCRTQIGQKILRFGPQAIAWESTLDFTQKASSPNESKFQKFGEVAYTDLRLDLNRIQFGSSTAAPVLLATFGGLTWQ